MLWSRRWPHALGRAWIGTTASLALLFICCGLASARAAPAFQVTDERGVSVAFSQPPQRIVSLLPSLTETVCALGYCDRLVGVDRYSNDPPGVQSLPQVGGGLDPDIEGIVALRPDVVLMAGSSRVGERLQSLGIKVLALEPKNHADVRRVIEKIGQLLQLADAERIWRSIDASVAATARSLPASVKTLRVYFEVNRAPYAASESSFIGETLARLGVQNIVAGKLGPFPKINPEFVVRANPDVIIVGDRSYLGLDGRPGWDHIQAVRDRRVCVLNAAQIDIVVRPGPRMAQGARIIADCLRGLAP